MYSMLSVGIDVNTLVLSLVVVHYLVKISIQLSDYKLLSFL